MASRGQLLALGMSDRAMQYRVRRSGPWQKLLPGVYLAATGIPSLDRTRRRHDRMAAAGIILLHFSPGQIRREPAEVAQMIKGALERGLRRPGLPIRTIPCETSARAKV